jgi:diguanylate cyclase (GGDEF)-like protein/PAS domain S-box-containing protein
LPKDELTPELIGRTVQQAMERWKLEREHRILAAAFQTGQATMITDADGRIQRVNAAFTAITGYSEAEVVGNDPRLMGSGLHDSDFFRAVWTQLAQEGSWQGEVWNRHKTGRLLPVWQTIAAVTDQRGAVEHYVSVFHDISEQKRLEDEMAWLAATDPLTGLANRRRFLKAAREEVAGAPSHGKGLSLIMVDVDHFKAINDSHGHDSGDLALTALAEILTRNLREEELVGRIGGEEFAVLLPGTDPRRAAAVAERLRSRVAETGIHGTDTPFQITISLGIAAWRGPHETVDRLLARADEELYAAKQAGRNRVRGGIVA